jgi:hypothetical protein
METYCFLCGENSFLNITWINFVIFKETGLEFGFSTTAVSADKGSISFTKRTWRLVLKTSNKCYKSFIAESPDAQPVLGNIVKMCRASWKLQGDGGTGFKYRRKPRKI